ncbi:MAG: hypothetical protein SGPRY_000165 [Prymnesium sp.]
MGVRKVAVQGADAARRPAEVDVNAFLKSYPPVPVDGGGSGAQVVLRAASEGVGKFDVRPFANLLKVARAVGLLEGRAWLVPYEKAQGFLEALSGDEVRSELRTRIVAARVDQDLGRLVEESESLRTAAMACGGEALSPADRGELVQDALSVRALYHYLA